MVDELLNMVAETRRRFEQTLLEVWQEVGRHIEIEESMSHLAELLSHHFPIVAIEIRRIDVRRSLLETVAIGTVGAPRITPSPHPARSELVASRLEQLLSWARQGRNLMGEAEAINARFPGFVPESHSGAVLAGPLFDKDAPAAIVLFLAQGRKAFSPQHEKMFLQILEPFTVAFENDRRVRELLSLREAALAEKESLLTRLGRPDNTDTPVGAETGLKPVMERVHLVSASHVPVLIFGETGSGKEVIARAIHQQSPRSSGPFLRVNCGAIPPDLIDSELFGHERGSFTGAIALKRGWFERADGGTLFLDEIGELPLAAQVRLLRILEDGTFERVGGERMITVDVRIVAATHRDLQAMVLDGRFREDLWYRLAVFPIRLPALRDRIDDIAELASHFAARACKRFGFAPLVATNEDVRLLSDYPWPGNVRELRAVIERAAILGNGRTLEVAKALGTSVPTSAPSPPTAAETPFAPPKPQTFPTLDEAMARHIEAALEKTAGRIEGPRGAAKLLRINPHTLRARMRKLKITWQRFRVPLE